MSENGEGVLGNKNGRRIGPQGSAAVHPSQWYPAEHPRTSNIPFLVSPRSITRIQAAGIRRIWQAHTYQGRDFCPFEVSSVPNKYRLAELIACGLKASCATYSQHWQGMYFDWTFNEELERALASFTNLPWGERFVQNAFATVVLFNTGYHGIFMDMLRLRRRRIPPSMDSLENIDMGTFEHNLKSAVGAVLGGNVGVNVIKRGLARGLVEGGNREGYARLRQLSLLEGMHPEGNISCILQLGFKVPEERESFEPALMALAGAKIIERRSERRGVDFTRSVPQRVLHKFMAAFRRELKACALEDCVRMIMVEGDTAAGKEMLIKMRACISQGMSRCREETLAGYEANTAEGKTALDPDPYRMTADLTYELGLKVLKPREDAQRMVFVYIDLEALSRRSIAVETAEHYAGEAIQAGLNCIHLEGTTNIPAHEDLRYGAFCLTGPIHSCELNDTDAQLERGWGQGFWSILAPELPPTNKMLALIAISAKAETDAFVAEIQAMEQRKSINDIFWYKTWNHPEGKQLDVPHWVSFASELNVLPIPGNQVPMPEKPLPEHLPADHPLTRELLERLA